MTESLGARQADGAFPQDRWLLDIDEFELDVPDTPAHG
jgi:hypothetical protein